MLTKLLRNMVTERFPASNAARVRGIARSTCRIAPRSRWNEGHEHLLNAMMKPFLAIIAIALVAPPAQAQELANEIVDGLDRICLYRTGKLGERTGELGAETISFKVGMNQPCPATFPLVDRNLAAPPSAALRSSSVSGANRFCVYEQGRGSWTIALPLSSSCPLAAGMAAQILERARGSSR